MRDICVYARTKMSRVVAEEIEDIKSGRMEKYVMERNVIMQMEEKQKCGRLESVRSLENGMKSTN